MIFRRQIKFFIIKIPPFFQEKNHPDSVENTAGEKNKKDAGIVISQYETEQDKVEHRKNNV
ncbi:hypothetical protein GCM10011413_17700 [Pedobacter psychrotolerans]|uniref:Uncharacterized protein n=1 Tax=Pedobacter psychrotolerans TaxID=1843235 RepID=A0ABQ1SNY9_9SPHI|nr:hypothetical protein GCM10011413_17700 [Pedobacter psychrotolerans]